MPQIVFSILATPAQRSEIDQDFRDVLAANIDVLTATLSVSLDSHADTGADIGLAEVWHDQGFADRSEEVPEPAQFVVDILAYQGSLSGLSMRLSEVLTERGKPPAEALFRQILDDPGVPRVPWHVEVRP